MKDRSAFFAACCIAATAVAVLVSGCESSDSRARDAYNDYQTAMAGGNLRQARRALQHLVRIEDDNPTYWEELGKIQLQLKNYESAYYAFTRAQELDSGNAEILGALTQLALLSGNTEAAEKNAKQLELVAPGHPAAKMAYGYVYLQRQDYDKADQQVDALLATVPFDSNVKLLKARILLGRKEPDKAIQVLQEQVKARPDDGASWKALMLLQERQNNWPAVAVAANRLHQIDPKDADAATTFIEASLRSNDVAAARAASAAMLGQDAGGGQVSDVLKVWAQHWKSAAAIAEARRLASSASAQQRLAYATYFIEVGSPDDAIALVGDSPKRPVEISNYSLNSVIAAAMALKGQRAEAKRLFDEILAREPDHVYALRGRTNLEISTGDAKAAIVDAQRLVSVAPDSATDRALLARAYAAAGDRRQVDRTLWNAFHEIPANFDTYEPLRQYVLKTDGADAAKAIDDEFKEQRDIALAREFI
jgi:predicted Zn-dependent protease